MESSDDLIHLFEQVRSDFDRLRFQNGPISATLVHRASNAEVEGVLGIPSPQRSVVALQSAGHREFRWKLDKAGHQTFRTDPILDVRGTPIANSAGEPFDVIMPATRSVFFTGASADFQMLQNIAQRAGRLIPRFNNAAIQELLAGWQFSNPEDIWWAVVFELSWNNSHPLVKSTRKIWAPSEHPTVFFPYDISDLRRLAKLGADGMGKSIPEKWLDRLPDAFCSELQNFATLSFDMADFLLRAFQSRSTSIEKDSAINKAATLSKASLRRRFAVALSFPGEQRKIVEEVASALASSLDRSRVFYDRYYEPELSRPNLDLVLQQFYANEADLVVVFVCGEYREKEWCGIEWRAIRDLMKNRLRPDEDVMILRLDRKELPGLLSVDGFLDITGMDPQKIADAIIRRWSMSR